VKNRNFSQPFGAPPWWRLAAYHESVADVLGPCASAL
jgi:hypothetical protein